METNDGGVAGLPVWNCFPGAAPPEAVVLGWRMLLGLPLAAQRNLWHLIGATLAEPNDSEHRQLVEGYAQRFDANVAHVMGALRAVQILLRQGASLNLEEAPFRADLAALSAGNAAGIELLMPRYIDVRNGLREQLLENTLADHGNVLTAFDWRLDRVQVSNHGQMEDVSVLMLNLKYRSGGEPKQLALQLAPNAVELLRAFWSQFSPT